MTGDQEDLARMVLGYFGADGGQEPGGFTHTIMQAYQRADPGNKQRLQLGFPELCRLMDRVANTPNGVEEIQRELNGETPPRLIVEHETFETDGSVFMERASLTARISKLNTEGKQLRGRTMAALQILDRIVEGWSESTLSPQVKALIREARMALSGGMAMTQQQQADAVVEEWLQDPERNVFGLAADLVDVLSRRK